MKADQLPQLTLSLQLDELIRTAQAQWGRLATRRLLTTMQVMQGLQVHQRTIEKYLADTATRLQLDVLARICWYFGVSIDMVLAVDAGRGADRPPIALGRATAPLHLPPVGGIRVVNFIPAEVELQTAEIEALTGWKQQSVDVLLSGGQRRVYRRTLETLLPVLGYTRVSQLLDVQCDLDAVDPEMKSLEESVLIFEPRPIWLEADWHALATQWRALTGAGPVPGSVTDTDIAVLRYVAAALPEQFNHRRSRLANVIAAGLGVTRALVLEIVHGVKELRNEVEQLPPAIRQLLDPVLDPDWRTTAACKIADQYRVR